MTPAVSVSSFRSEFDDFLYAPIGAEKNEMPLSVLSALTRLNLDPWKEAAELSELSQDSAAQRLASSIAKLPGGHWAQADLGTIASHLVGLLPHRGSTRAPPADQVHRARGMTAPALTTVLICAALGITALVLIAASREPSAQGDHADTPAFNRASPPQTSSPDSR